MRLRFIALATLTAVNADGVFLREFAPGDEVDFEDAAAQVYLGNGVAIRATETPEDALVVETPEKPRRRRTAAK